MRSLMIYTDLKILFGGVEKRMQGFCGGNLRDRVQLGYTGVVGRIILRWIFRK
jgi:hypothetical protein